MHIYLHLFDYVQIAAMESKACVTSHHLLFHSNHQGLGRCSVCAVSQSAHILLNCRLANMCPMQSSQQAMRNQQGETNVDWIICRMTCCMSH